MSAKALILLLAVIFVESKISDERNRPTTVTPLGKVEGEWRTSFEGRKYASFEGIPYAKPPIGDLRFAEPHPAEPWVGVWNATKIYECPHTTMIDRTQNPSGDEDCLYLNVYIPVRKQLEKLDVVIHIHGGGFIYGYSNEFIGEKYVMDRDLILVTFNYRIGALGFLSTGDEVVPGNNGLRDQTLVLHWVQNNIESFNGNPKSVTLTGFSAGAASLHLHYLTPHSKGLFHRGISLSGSALNPWTIRLNPLKNARRLAKSVGCEMDDTKKMVMCLKSRPASQLVVHTGRLHYYGGMPFCLFQPVVDKYAKKPFLEDLPENLLKAGRVLDVPWMASYTKDDGLMGLLVITDSIQQLNEQWTEVGHYMIQTDDIPLSVQQEALLKIKQHYSTSGEDMSFEDLVKLETDTIIRIGVERSIQVHAAAVKSPVYFNIFGYSGQNTLKSIFGAEHIEGKEGMT
ncbi:unnamed protein product [Acanthoscelides obtectus]|uniref:Carboxylesterase type B domain-containing protein n=1 Tax=Acanthoscelides obtectus TaxID=200917 RepID=A0A9P0LPZ6_ACAOB|nr:unnamed protein product [Acanthoscelides obtectus]CAK1654649.1 hypothetical protein AOBTE_LOCUS18738 [Acanthoscelides obtectus]